MSAPEDSDTLRPSPESVDPGARLISLSEEEGGRAYAIRHEAVVGRETGVDVQLDVPDVSRRHARLFRDGAGQWWIEDLGSRNGTLLNGVPLRGRHVVHVGDRIQLSSRALFVFARHDRTEDKLIELQKMAAVSQVASGVAHDFRNIIGALLMTLGHMDQQIRSGVLLQDELLACLADCTTAVHRANEIAEGLLTLSRKKDRRRSTIDVGDLVREVVGLCRRAFGSRITLRESIHPHLAIVGDRVELHQVLMNLCLNARDAMPQGGTLIVRAHREQIAADQGSVLLPPGEYLTIAVVDDGVGMDEATSSRIFEPFFTTKGDKGTGLGLATVYSIIRRHGGDIEVSSRPGEGTTFRIVLPPAPCGQPMPQDTLGPSRLGAPALAGPRAHGIVLLVHDVVETRGRIAHLLDGAGHQVVCAATGREGIACYEQHRGQVCCVILDMTLPDLQAREALRILRTIDPSARIVLTCAPAEQAEAEQLLEYGDQLLLETDIEEGLPLLLDDITVVK